MPLTLTYDEYVVQLGEYADNKAAGDYAAAIVSLDNAIAIRASLPDMIVIAGGQATLANMAQLLALKADLGADATAATRRSGSRIIGAGVSHPRRS